MVETRRARRTDKKELNGGDAFDASLRIVENCLSDIIRGFKSAAAKRINESGITNFAWQSRFYDRIIRNEKELFNIRKYIDQNPLKWEYEKNNSEIFLIYKCTLGNNYARFNI